MMGFVWLDERHSSPVTKLSDDHLHGLEQEFLFLRSKTGVFLDPYSNTRLAPDHAKLLSEAIKANGPKSKGIKRFAAMLDESVRSGRWIMALGD
jgi:hypothetical protein